MCRIGTAKFFTLLLLLYHTSAKGAGRASAEYQTAFWNAMRKKNYYDVNNALSIGEDAEGGYLVPDEFERKLVEGLEEESFFRTLATVIRTSSGDRKIPMDV